ncbi:uncharacterized protein K02A2.6-like [Anneissia japonica]|uniref:uncharacterized protein K02A2.6-like n=1 Tax=Anneissia japonica TaxID=1529436 RepID=UPI0014257A7E|nr:uncharacterized protein K02A2.6-like [Anneissia japonica]
MREAKLAIKREKHPIPTTEEIITDLNKAQFFSTLDLKAGYHQFELHLDSRYTKFTTHSGLFCYKRLMFGVNAASEIFQNTVARMLAGLKGCRNMSDDIVVCGTTKQEHDDNLKAVLQRLKNCNARLNKDKCTFSKTKVSFFGHIFSGDGVSLDPQKIAAIVNMKPPKNAKEIRSFLGMAQYVSRFIPGYASLSTPLRLLTHNNVEWTWGETEQQAFIQLKDKLAKADVTAYFNPNLATVVVADASPTGLGAMLCQEGRVVAYASRTLTNKHRIEILAIEREALGVTWAITHFHMYLFGSKFTVYTDHKPLLSLFNNKNSKPTARIQLWLLRLQQYNFTLNFKAGTDKPSDYLSRHPVTVNTVDRTSQTADDYVNYVCRNAVPKAMTHSEVSNETQSDPAMQKLKLAIMEGNASCWKDSDIADFKAIKHEFSVKDNVILRDTRIVLPISLRLRAVDLAHKSHQGIVKTKQLIREKVWFPGIDSMVERKVKNCLSIVIIDRFTTKATENVKASRKRISTGNHRRFSRFPEVEIVSSTSAKSTIPKLDAVVARQGIPDIVKSDNGPPFNGFEFSQFSQKCTPLWPRANGEAERFMRTLLKLVHTSTTSGLNWKQELWTFLRKYRATPYSTKGKSPSEALNGRKLKTTLPQAKDKSTGIHQCIRGKDRKKKDAMKANADKHLHAKPTTINIGDKVLIKQKRRNMLDPPFNPEPFVVVERKGNCITAQQGEISVTRNCTLF